MAEWTLENTTGCARRADRNAHYRGNAVMLDAFSGKISGLVNELVLGWHHETRKDY